MNKSNKAAPRKAKGSKQPQNTKHGSGGKTERKTSRPRAVLKEQKPSIRESSKIANVIAMLRQPNGASIEDISKATGWQAHSVRGAISGAIKKKLSLAVTSEKTDGVRTYRITG